MSYKTSNAEGHVDFINTYDLEPMAQQVIPKAAFGYIASGAEDTFTLRENIRAFNHKLIVPHTLCDVENPSTEIEFAGEKLSSPIIMAPVAAHKLANEQGEVATARGVHEFGSLYTTSSYSTVDLPEISEALQGTPHWFQFYFSKDDGINRHIMDRVKAEGYKAIVLTADATVGGNREVDKRNGFVFPVGMPIVFDSGVRRGQHVFKALASGADLVAIGRPVIYGLALGGSVGVRQVFEHLNAELKTVMQLSGAQTIEDVKHFKLRHNPYNPTFPVDPRDLKLY
ncbi:alpha-hydroxy-acid oxidizing protein [Streptococcus pneumoniae]|uniref:alpha-hydroxy-acid oxidizing protein n=1 Tax=Streptococcus pneumoniae TaxID=1313 RepID=UPI0005E7EDF6|nr:alpha-hydroxy-acid oxidizing protein [Streptococcus pneumoniae]CMW85112.1 lactate oxidase [Streptococcus pneumoniae]VSG42205.1 lactate oxidase [Streptococcus pneumoniae]